MGGDVPPTPIQLRPCTIEVSLFRSLQKSQIVNIAVITITSNSTCLSFFRFLMKNSMSVESCSYQEDSKRSSNTNFHVTNVALHTKNPKLLYLQAST